jgi:thiamine biosynthesis protein ThiS
MATKTELIEIVVNGDRTSVPEGSTVTGLLGRLGLDPARVAVELDRRIVRREAWSETVLAPGSTLEIVQFVGGG